MTNIVGRKIARFVPLVGFQHVLMLILLFPIVMLSVLLAGCTSNNMSGVYLMSLRYNAQNYSVTTGAGQVNTLISHAVQNVTQTGNGTTLEVRAGYRGLCVGQNSEDRICSSSAKALANMIGARHRAIKVGNGTLETTPDPLNLIMVAEEFRQKIVFDGLIYVVVALCFLTFITLSTFPGWHTIEDDDSFTEVRPFPARSVSHFTLTMSVITVGFGFISVLWQHINSSSTAAMAEILTYGAVKGSVGATAMVLGWVSVCTASVVCVALLLMIQSIKSINLDRKLDDEMSESESY